MANSIPLYHTELCSSVFKEGNGGKSCPALELFPHLTRACCQRPRWKQCGIISSAFSASLTFPPSDGNYDCSLLALQYLNAVISYFVQFLGLMPRDICGWNGKWRSSEEPSECINESSQHHAEKRRNHLSWALLKLLTLTVFYLLSSLIHIIGSYVLSVFDVPSIELGIDRQDKQGPFAAFIMFYSPDLILQCSC